MRNGQNRERILNVSLNLFNQSGTLANTTNHIAKDLKISPGNLYFHFADREAIIRELFKKMNEDIYKLWKPEKENVLSPVELIEKSFDVFWNYRFFHREIYMLRHKDPLLAQMWRRHMKNCTRLLVMYYKVWIKEGIMRPIKDPKEMQMVVDIVITTSSSFLHFYESKQKPATRRLVKQGIQHIVRLLMPYHIDKLPVERYLD